MLIMKSYKKITNYNYMENCCKCEEYKEQLDTQNSRITCLEYEINKNMQSIFLLIEIRWKSKAFLSNEINCRNLYLLNKLKELSSEQITLINNRICKNEDLIGEIIKYLDSNIDKSIQINDDELEDIENWWLY